MQNHHISEKLKSESYCPYCGTLNVNMITFVDGADWDGFIGDGISFRCINCKGRYQIIEYEPPI